MNGKYVPSFSISFAVMTGMSVSFSGVLDKYEAPADGYISLLKIPELRVIKRPGEKTSSKWTPRWQLPKETKGAMFGAAVTLSELIKELDHLSRSPGYRHCAQMAKHLRVVANTPVRNAATWAGNLMIKYKHREFPSDVFLLLTAAGAKLKIGELTMCLRTFFSPQNST